MTCVGTFSYIGEGELLEAEGTLHSSIRRMGSSFRVEYVRDQDIRRMRCPWSGILDPGRSRGSARHWLPESCDGSRADTFRIIEEEPERLAEIKGISERKAREIAAAD